MHRNPLPIAACALALVVFVPVFPCSGQSLSLDQSSHWASIIDWKDFKRLPLTNCSCGETWVSNLDVTELKSLAGKGHVPSQCLLARLFYTGKQGLPENKLSRFSVSLRSMPGW